jgi:collagenase-like PrtC family protease
MSAIELLAPAKDLETGIAAIDCGADAVYVGASRFSAREAAGNSLADIAALARYAHRYWARVYAAVNTILRDDELEAAVRLCHDLHGVGVDGLIIQDVGLLECDLPPLPLIASTQMHNHTPERVAFLEQVGFARAILARELDLDGIAAIRRATTLALEVFVHGALCVGMSGRCTLSYALGGRSGNRGQCAQPCRRGYALVDGAGKTVLSERHLLSLRDLNLTAQLGELLAAGITSFKIEGRLKNQAYVMNVVGHYRQALDQVLAPSGDHKSSSGKVTLDFLPNPDKTFNRGYTTYFLHGRGAAVASPASPKHVGEPIGSVTSVSGDCFTLDQAAALHSGDGITFYDRDDELAGSRVNHVRGATVFPQKLAGIAPGTRVFRNHDHAFADAIAKRRPAARSGWTLCYARPTTASGSRALTMTASALPRRWLARKSRPKSPSRSALTCSIDWQDWEARNSRPSMSRRAGALPPVIGYPAPHGPARTLVSRRRRRLHVTPVLSLRAPRLRDRDRLRGLDVQGWVHP